MSIFTRIFIYYGAYAAGFALMLVLSLIRCGLHGISRARAAVYSFLCFAVGVGGARLIGVIYNALFTIKGIETDVSVDVLGALIFNLFFLMAAVPLENLFRKRFAKQTQEDGQVAPRSFRDTIDLIMPGAFLVFASIKFGCHIRGCCYGVIWEHGIKSPLGDIRVFPVQLCESATILAIAAAGCFMMRAGFYRRGMAAPLFANMYGVTRFGWEFLRFNPPEMRNYALGMTVWQLFCLLVIVVTAVWLAVLVKTRPAEPLQKSKKPSKTAGKASAPKKSVSAGNSGTKAAHKKRAKRKKK